MTEVMVPIEEVKACQVASARYGVAALRACSPSCLRGLELDKENVVEVQVGREMVNLHIDPVKGPVYEPGGMAISVESVPWAAACTRRSKRWTDMSVAEKEVYARTAAKKLGAYKENNRGARTRSPSPQGMQQWFDEFMTGPPAWDPLQKEKKIKERKPHKEATGRDRAWWMPYQAENDKAKEKALKREKKAQGKIEKAELEKLEVEAYKVQRAADERKAVEQMSQALVTATVKAETRAKGGEWTLDKEYGQWKRVESTDDKAEREALRKKVQDAILFPKFGRNAYYPKFKDPALEFQEHPKY